MNEDGSVDLGVFTDDLRDSKGSQGGWWTFTLDDGKAFTAVKALAAHYMALGAKREREACAKICDKRIKVWRDRIGSIQYEYTYENALKLKTCHGHLNEAECLAHDIRARGEVGE